MTEKPKRRHGKLTAPKVASIKADLLAGKSQRQTGRDNEISSTAVHRIANNRGGWEWVQPEKR